MRLSSHCIYKFPSKMVNSVAMEFWKPIDDDEEIDLDNLVINIVDDELAKEGIGKLLSYGLLAFLLGSAGIVEGATFDREMEKLVKDKKVQNGKVTVTKDELKKVIDKSKKKPEMVGKWELAKAKNVIARTLYMESREDGKQGLEMTMTVIWNRAGKGMKDQLVSEALRPSQFSCWNDIPSSKKNPTTYQIQFPSCVQKGSGADFDMWNECVKIAESAYNGTFKPVDEHWNAYYNPKKCHPSWASLLKGATIVGHHRVGELKDQTQHANNIVKWKQKQQQANQTVSAQSQTPTSSQFSKVKFKDYKVKDKDTLWDIAGKKMSVVNKIKELNGLKSDIIRPGQKLKLPS